VGIDSSNRGPSQAFAKETTLNPVRLNPLRVITPCLLAAAAIAVASRATPVAATPAAPAPATVQVGKPPTVQVGNPATKNARIIEGDDHLFLVAAPEGWVLDDTSGMGSRIRCVFYPKGQKWSTAATVMYVNPLHGYSARQRTMLTLIAEDEKAFKKRSPRGRITEGGTLPTGATNKLARVRYFAEDGGAPHEAVAYVPEKELIMLVVLSARSAQSFQQSLPAYRELVQSYAWVGSHSEFGR
jgi:hypothetical protein